MSIFRREFKESLDKSSLMRQHLIEEKARQKYIPTPAPLPNEVATDPRFTEMWGLSDYPTPESFWNSLSTDRRSEILQSTNQPINLENL